jgi:hypothetical protein
MELDELKKELNFKIASQHKVSSVDIRSMLKNDTVSIVQKIQRSIRLEIVISILFVAVCIYMVLFENTWIYNVYFSLFGIVGLVFIIVLLMLLKKTKKISISPVKENIESIVLVIDQYVKRYLQFTVVLLPFCFGLSLWLSYNDPERILKPMDISSILYISLTMLAIGTGVYFFTRWYLKKLYGEYIVQLKALLIEFDEH